MYCQKNRRKTTRQTSKLVTALFVALLGHQNVPRQNHTGESQRDSQNCGDGI
jgi:hypothetical protein